MRSTQFVRVVSALLTALLVSFVPTHSDAQWLLPRYDAYRSGFVPGASDITEPAISWRVEVGQSAHGYSVFETDIDGGLPELVTISQGVLVARDRLGRVVWSTETRNFDAILGQWDFDGDGAREILAARRHVLPALYLIDTATGEIIWEAEDFEVAAFDLSSRNIALADVTEDGLLEVIVSPQIQEDIRCYSFADGFSSSTLVWSTTLEGYANLIPPITGDFLANAGTEVLVMQIGGYAVIDGQTGTILAAETGVFSGHHFGFMAAYDADEDGLDEVVHVGVGHISGRRVGVLDPQTTDWNWLYEYQQSSGSIVVSTVHETLLDMTGDPHPELAVSFFNNTDTEVTEYPPGTEHDADGVNLADHWTTVVFDVVSGNVVGQYDDTFLAGLADVDGDGQADLILTDTSEGEGDGTAFATHVIMSVDEGQLGIVDDSFLIRGTIMRSGERSHFNANTNPVQLDDSVVFIVDDSDQPVRYVAVVVTGGELVESAERVLEEGQDWQLLREGESSTVIGFDQDQGLVVWGNDLSSLSVVIEADGEVPEPLVAIQPGGTRQIVFKRYNGRLQSLSLSATTLEPEMLWQTSDGVTGDVGGYTTLSGDVLWLAVQVLADHSVAVALNQSGEEAWSYPIGSGQNALWGVATAGSTASGVYVPIEDRIGHPDSPYIVVRLEPESGAPLNVIELGLESGFRGVGLAFPLEDDAPGDYVVASGSQVAAFSDTGTLVGLVDNRGGNVDQIMADLDGDGSWELISTHVWFEPPFEGSGTCAYDLQGQATVWCSPQRFYGDVSFNPPAVLPIVGQPDGIVFTNKAGEVRLLAGDSGLVVWSMCLSDGAGYEMPTDMSQPLTTPCPSLPLSAPVSHDLDGDSVVEVLVGGSDGFLYVLTPTGVVEQSYDLRAPVGSIVLADLDGDGLGHELLLALGDGTLVAVDQASVEAPSEVLDVAIDPADDSPGHTDIDETEDFTQLASRWTSVSGAANYRVRLYDSNGFPVAADDDVGTDETALVFNDLLLAIGETYTFGVTAITESGYASLETLSDGVVIIDPGVPWFRVAWLEPDVFSQGERVDTILHVEAASRAGLDELQVTFQSEELAVFDGEGAAEIEYETLLEDLTNTDGTPLEPGLHQVTVTITDIWGVEASEDLTVEVVPIQDDREVEAEVEVEVEPDAGQLDVGDMAPDAPHSDIGSTTEQDADSNGSTFRGGGGCNCRVLTGSIQNRGFAAILALLFWVSNRRKR